MSSELRKKLIFIVVVLVILAVVALFGSRGNMSSWGKADNAWYAVYLNNNQVYFGHIAGVKDDVITLKDVRYAEQVTVPAQIAKSKNFAVEQPAQQSFKITSRGSDATLASDHTLYINRSTVLYWEKLSADAGVVKMIEGVNK